MDVFFQHRPGTIGAEIPTASGIQLDSSRCMKTCRLEAVIEAANTSVERDDVQHCIKLLLTSLRRSILHRNTLVVYAEVFCIVNTILEGW